MTGIRKIFLDETYFSSLDTAPTNVNVIICNPLLYDFVHDGTVQNKETISLQGVAKTEVAYASRDASAGNIGKYCFNPADNTLCLLVDPAIVTSDALAKDYLKGILVEYQMISLDYLGSTPLYVMRTSYSNGVFVGETLATDFTTLENKILAYDDDLNVNTVGYYEHTIHRALEAA